MTPYIAVLLGGVIALLSWHISRLQTRIDQLTDRLVARSDDALVREERIRASSSETGEKLLTAVSDAVTKQVSVLQESVKVAWTPQPPPQTGQQGLLPEKVRELYTKYNLPVPGSGLSEHDIGEDPTDQFLHERHEATHTPAVMLPGSDDPLDSDEPFGVPGLKSMV